MLRHFLILFSIMLLFGLAEADEITFDDLYSVPRISDPVFSPDGEEIAFTLKIRYPEHDSSLTRIWFYSLKDKSIREDTLFGGDCWGWEWSSKGRFISVFSGFGERSGLVIKPIHTGRQYGPKSDKILDIPLPYDPMPKLKPPKPQEFLKGIKSFSWAQSESFIVGHKLTYPDCLTDSCNEARDKEIEELDFNARVYDHLLYRHYKSWDDGKINQLYISGPYGGIRQFTFGPHSVPTTILGGYQDYAVSPDGQEICYVMCTDSMPAMNPNNDLFVIPIEGGEPRRITINKGQDFEPRYSPDGKYISYKSQARFGYESDQNELILMDRETGAIENLTVDFDRSVGGYKWSSDSRYIYFSAIEYGLRKIWRLEVENKAVELVLGDACYGYFDLSPDGKHLAVTRSLSNQPYELYLYEIESKEMEQVTFFSKEITDRLEMNRAESFRFEGFNGDSVHGWLTLPPDFDSTQKYPLVLLIHGGPQWCWLGDFNYYGWNTQLTAAQGYVVAQIDPHGSVGYGLKFKEYVSGNWGKGEYEDLMIGVDYLIENYSFIDSTRMAALGRSYGGFMTNWICGHTDRFDCLITIDGVFDQVSDFYSTEELWFPIWEFKGTPVSNPEEYRRASPSSYVADFKTPTMVIHGQKDYRVDVSQAFQMFTALQLMGVPSELLYYPDEGHSISKISNLRHVYNKQFEWLTRWLDE